MNLNKILVIGPGSLTGSRFIELLPKDIRVWGAGGSLDENSNVESFIRLDITDSNAVLETVKNTEADLVINFAGITDVDGAEKHKPQDINNQSQLENDLTYKVNVLGTKNLVEAIKQTSKFPIFISTGFVFDGRNGPYTEEDLIAASSDDVGWYAWTKILAEKEVINSGVDFLMIRISYPYRKEYEPKGDFARNFIKIYDEFKSGVRDSIYPIFADQSLTPTFVDDLAPAILTLLEKKDQKGIFHVTSSESTTPYEFACEVLKVARDVENPEQLLTKGSIIEFQKLHPELATRPLHGGEKSEKIARLGFTPTSWRDGIRKAFS